MGEKEADMKNDIIQNIRLDMNAPKSNPVCQSG